jgi:hypothetical protein
MGAVMVRVYKRFAQSVDTLPRVGTRAHTIDTDYAPTIERYRRPIGAVPREDANRRESAPVGRLR